MTSITACRKNGHGKRWCRCRVVLSWIHSWQISKMFIVSVVWSMAALSGNLAWAWTGGDRGISLSPLHCTLGPPLIRSPSRLESSTGRAAGCASRWENLPYPKDCPWEEFQATSRGQSVVTAISTGPWVLISPLKFGHTGLSLLDDATILKLLRH